MLPHKITQLELSINIIAKFIVKKPMNATVNALFVYLFVFTEGTGYFTRAWQKKKRSSLAMLTSGVI